MKIYEDKHNDLEVKNASLQDELLGENIANVAFVQRIVLLEKQCEDANASATSSSFSKFSQEEFKELALKTNQEHYELISELFKNLDSIFETHLAFDKMFATLEDQVERREKDSKAYDDVVDW